MLPLRVLLLCGLLAAAYGFSIGSPRLTFWQRHVNPVGHQGQKVFCVVTSPSERRQERTRLEPENIDVALCTHITYGHSLVRNGRITPRRGDLTSRQEQPGMYERIANLKHKKQGLETLLAIGGRRQNPQQITQILRNRQARQTFIKYFIPFLREHSWDGVVINWMLHHPQRQQPSSRVPWEQYGEEEEQGGEEEDEEYEEEEESFVPMGGREYLQRRKQQQQNVNSDEDEEENEEKEEEDKIMNVREMIKQQRKLKQLKTQVEEEEEEEEKKGTEYEDEESEEDEDEEEEDEEGQKHFGKLKFVLFLKELREAIQEETRTSGKPRLQLIVAIPGNVRTIQKYRNIKRISQIVDLIMVKSFLMNTRGQRRTTIHSPLRLGLEQTRRGGITRNTQEGLVNFLRQQGIPVRKLVLGLALFGRSFTLRNPNRHEVGALVTGLGQPGPFTQRRGILSYPEICQKIQQGWKHAFLQDQVASYAHQGNQWVGYDDVQSIQQKVQFIKKMKLAGALVTALGMDDFTGQYCKQGRFPLLTKVSEVLQGQTTD